MDKILVIGSKDWLASRLNEIGDISNRNKKYESLNKLIHEILPSQSEVIERVKDLAKSVEDPEKKIKALAKVASCLPETERNKLLDNALNIFDHDLSGNEKTENSKLKAFITIANQLPRSDSGLQVRALNIASSIIEKDEEGNYFRITALLSVVSRLDNKIEAWQKAFQTANLLEDEFGKIVVLSRIIDGLPQEHESLWEEAYRSIENFNEIRKAFILSKIIFHQSEVNESWSQELENLLRKKDLVQSSDDTHIKIISLVHLASKRENLYQENYLQRIINELNIFPYIFSNWPELSRMDLLHQAMKLIEDAIRQQASDILPAQTGISHHEQDQYEKNILIYLYKIGVTAAIIESTRKHVSTENQNLLDHINRHEVLIADRLSSFIETIKFKYLFSVNKSDRIQAILKITRKTTEIAYKFTEAQKSIIFDQLILKTDEFMARSHNDNPEDIDRFIKLSLLSLISSRLSEARRCELIEEVVDLANSFTADTDQSLISDLLVNLLDFLPKDNPSIFRKILLIINSINFSPYRKTSLFLQFAKHISEFDHKLLSQFLEKSKAFNSIQIFESIASKLPESESFLIKKSLETAGKFETQSQKIDALVAVVPKLPTAESSIHQLKIVLDFLQSDKDFLDVVFNFFSSSKYNQSLLSEVDESLLSSVVSRLVESEGVYLRESLKIAQEIDQLKFKIKSCSLLADKLPEPQRTNELIDIISSYGVRPTTIDLFREDDRQLIARAYDILNESDDSVGKVNSLFSISRLYSNHQSKQIIQDAFNILKSLIRKDKEEYTPFGSFSLSDGEEIYEHIAPIIVEFSDILSKDEELFLECLTDILPIKETKEYLRIKTVCEIANTVSVDLGKK